MKLEFSWAEHSTIRQRLLFLVASTYKIARPTLLMWFDNQQTAANALSGLRAEGLIESSNTHPAIIKLSHQGVDWLRFTDPALYEYYQRNTNYGNPGRTARHAELRQRAAETMTLMEAAGIKISSQRPSVQQIFSAEREANTTPSAVYYQMKELRYTDDQAEARSSLSRAAGLLMGPSLQGLVYNLGATNMEFSRSTERTTILSMGLKARELYKGLPYREIKNSIVICENDAAAARILCTCSARNSRKYCFGDAVKSKEVLYTDIRYIPLSVAGADYLRFITNTSQDQIMQMLFSQEEMDAARANKVGDAIIGDLIVYEFVSCNVSKLAVAKKLLQTRDDIGFVVRESQVDFVSDFLQRAKLNLRVYEDDDQRLKL